MKKLILAIGLLCSLTTFAQQVTVEREQLGSGQPNATGIENATKWDNDIYHAPQYMSGYPTAATIYPRIVDVKCTKNGDTLNCSGYHWLPEMGRGEYLMIHPVVQEVVKPPEVKQEAVITVIPVREFTPIVTKKPVKRKKVVQRVCTQWSK